jgi:polyhydroxyalkanoate synthesis regulator phasin
MAEQMESMQVALVQAESGRATLDGQLADLGRTLDRMTDKIAQVDNSEMIYALQKVASGQEQLVETMQVAIGQGQNQSTGEGGEFDAEAKMRLRSIDVQLLHILEDLAAGRQETMAELRTDIAALTRAVQRLGSADLGAATRLRRHPEED